MDEDENQEVSESAMQRSTIRKPFKVAGRSGMFKGTVAGSVLELKQKAWRTLGMSIPLDSTRLYLEEDGTEVDDDEYFLFLEDNTRIYLLQETDFHHVFCLDEFRKRPSSFERSESQVLISDTDSTDAGHRLPPSVIQTLKTTPTFFVDLSQEELDIIADVPLEELTKAIGSSINECRVIQQACEKESDRRRGLREATDLLQMYRKATASESEKLPHKRTKEMP